MRQSGDGIFTDVEWSTLASDLSLSPRQSQVAQAIIQGLSDKQIASKLRISTPTVRYHLSAVFAQLDVQDRCELLIHIFDHFRSSSTE